MIRYTVIFVDTDKYFGQTWRSLARYSWQSFNGIWPSNVWLYADIIVIGNEILYTLAALYFGEAWDIANFAMLYRRVATSIPREFQIVIGLDLKGSIRLAKV